MIACLSTSLKTSNKHTMQIFELFTNFRTLAKICATMSIDPGYFQRKQKGSTTKGTS